MSSPCRPALRSCTSRSIATRRDEIRAPQLQSFEPPASAVASAHWADANQRRARAGALEGHEHIVIGTGDVPLGPALRTPFPTEDLRSRCVNFNSLCLGEKFLVRVLWGALQRRVRFVGPNALQLGFSPWRFQRPGYRRGIC